MLRQAHESDLDALCHIQAGAFKFADNPDRCRHVREELATELEYWLVLEEDSQIVGATHVIPKRLRIGAASVLKGDVGGVAVPPELQGGGHGSRLLQETVAWQKANGFALSRLGGLAKFYARFGYVRFPRRYVEISVGQTVAAGSSQVREGEVPLPAEVAARVRSYDPATDGAAVRDLLNRFNAPYTGGPQPFADPPAAGPLTFVYDDGGPIAYLRANELDREYTEFEARIVIGEIACEFAQPQALQALVARIANHALQAGIPRITARFPIDPRVTAALAALPLRFMQIETFGGASCNMLQVISLPALAAQLLPELAARLAATDSRWRGTLGLTLNGEAATFGIDGASVVLTNDTPTLRLELPHATLLSLVLGLLSWEETESTLAAPPAGADRAVLCALFPRRLVYTGAGYWS